MANKIQTGIRRLEIALQLLRDGHQMDWYSAYKAAADNGNKGDFDDWRAVRDLIVIATHGAPKSMTYLGDDHDGDNKSKEFPWIPF